MKQPSVKTLNGQRDKALHLAAVACHSQTQLQLQLKLLLLFSPFSHDFLISTGNDFKPNELCRRQAESDREREKERAKTKEIEIN